MAAYPWWNGLRISKKNSAFRNWSDPYRGIKYLKIRCLALMMPTATTVLDEAKKL